MKKIILCTFLIFTFILQSMTSLAKVDSDDEDTPKLEAFGNYLVFPVTSKKASEYSCLHWKTQGFLVTVIDKDGTVVKADHKHDDVSGKATEMQPFLKYSSAAVGDRNFAVAIYKSAKGVVKGITGADGDITESIEDLYGSEAFKEIKKKGGTIKLEPLFTVLEGNTKTRIKVGEGTYKYVQEDFKDLNLYYTVEQISAGKWLGVSFGTNTIDDMITRRQTILFGPESESNIVDFYPVILRTGTEDGYYVGDEEKVYEAVVEMNALNYNSDAVPNINISITGGELCAPSTSGIKGGCTLQK